jgi:hypothetical protein
MYMKSGRKLVLAAMAASTLMVAGCATETAYRPATGHGPSAEGYSDRQIEADRYLVTFAGNSYTSRDTVEKYLLYRAAELTIQHGDDYFIMADRDTDKHTHTYATPGFGAYGGWGGYWGPSWRYRGRAFGWRSWDPFFGGPFWDRNIDVQTVEQYEASAEIITGKGRKPANNARAFDAHEVIDHIGPSVVLPK